MITTISELKEEKKRIRTLFKAVIARAFLDYVEGRPSYIADVKEWLNASDFETICDLAGCDKNVIREAFETKCPIFKGAIHHFNIIDRGR